jgi:hypothetical protein
MKKDLPMRLLRYFTALIAATGAAAAIVTAPAAVAQPGDSSTLPSCTGTGTECATHDNIQINATPSEPTYLYPWDDEFYGPALIIGGDGDHGRR